MLGFKTIEEFTQIECEEFLKRTDISADDRQRAERRRAYLLANKPKPKPEIVQPRKTIIEEFPEYGFRPTSLLGGPATKSKNYGKIPILIGAIYLFAGLVLLGIMAHYYVDAEKCERKAKSYSENAHQYELQGKKDLKYVAQSNWEKMTHKEHENRELGEIMLSIGAPLAFCGLVCLVIGCVYRKRWMPIKEVADYLASSRIGVVKGKSIFVKNKKFGVLKNNGFNEVIVPAEYDKLTWNTSKFLIGEINGKFLLVDIKGRRCTKPYDSLSWSNHKGVLRAEHEGRSFLVDIYDNELS